MAPPRQFPTPSPAAGNVHRARLRLAGRAVAEALVPGAVGSVLAVFPRSLYVAWDDQGPICLGAEGLGAGPLNGLCVPAAPHPPDGAAPWPSDAVAVGDPVHRVPGGLQVGARLHIATDGARTWHPVLPSASAKPEALRAGLHALQSAALQVRPRGLAVAVLDSPAQAAHVGVAERRLLALTAEAAHALQTWFHSADIWTPGNRPPPPERALGLLGLGPGLTPAGDDFLGGVLIALRAFGPGAWPDSAATALGMAISPLLETHTGPISAAHLKCALRGEGGEALHEAVTALAEGADTGWEQLLARLDAIGHSSGWDALAGILCVARTLGGNNGA